MFLNMRHMFLLYWKRTVTILCIYIINSSRGFNNFGSFFYCVFSV